MLVFGEGDGDAEDSDDNDNDNDAHDDEQDLKQHKELLIAFSDDEKHPLMMYVSPPSRDIQAAPQLL